MPNLTVMTGVPLRRWRQSPRHSVAYELVTTRSYARAMRIVAQAMKRGAIVEMSTRTINASAPPPWRTKRSRHYSARDEIHDVVDIRIQWEPEQHRSRGK